MTNWLFWLSLIVCLIEFKLVFGQFRPSPVAKKNEAEREMERLKDSPIAIKVGLSNSSPEENKKRLADLVDQMDADHDGLIELIELDNWIEQSRSKYVDRELEKQWKTHNPSGMEKLSWEEYRLATYAFLDSKESGVGDKDRHVYETMQKRDRRRWPLADLDNDGLLNKTEFMYLLHPERMERMRELIVQETMEDIDKDGDGKISIVEYIWDLYEPDDKQNVTVEANEDEPEWVQSERLHFKQVRDKNGDGYLDGEEVREWLAPAHVHSEGEQLIEEADANHDGKLSKQEVLDNYDLFVSSEATEYGEALAPLTHDEL